MTGELAECRIGFVGCGAMAQALAGGLLSAAEPPHRVVGFDPAPEQRAAFEALGATIARDNDELVASCDVVVLAVKPAVVAIALRELRETTQRHERTPPLWISIAAGIPIARLAEVLPADPRGSRIIRAMPNTPALVGAGATGLCANEAATPADRQIGEALFASVGEVWVATHETQIDAVTGLSGSGPAYLFLFIEALCEAGERVGLPAEAASRLALQTVFGASKLALESSDDPATLRKKVSSPGGTTLAGLGELEAGGLRDLVAKAVEAATARSRQLRSES